MAGAVAAPAIARAEGTGGVALVVGNSKYRWESALPNVRRDAPDIAKRLQALGLKVEVVMDLDRAAMLAAIDKVGAVARGAPFAAFYFAGHGVSWDYNTYLVPTDSDLSDAGTVKQLVHTNELYERLKGAQHSLMVFDACRNNPADGWRQVEALRTAVVRNPAKVVEAAPANSLVMFSTAPGHTALDGPAGQNSPFAAALLRQLSGSVDIASLPEKLRRALIVDTQGRQLLFDINAYKQPFVLGSGAPAAAGASPARELTKTYAFARENGIPLPIGLLAIPPSGPQHAAKVGAFSFEGRAQNMRFPEILAVLSVDESQGSAYVVMSAKTPLAYWRFIKANVAGDKIDFRPSISSAHYTFEWRGPDGGSMGQIWQSDFGARPHSARFTRLD